MQGVALCGEGTDSLYYTREGGMYASGDIGNSLIGKVDASFLRQRRKTNEMNHTSKPIELIATIKTFVVQRGLNTSL